MNSILSNLWQHFAWVKQEPVLQLSATAKLLAKSIEDSSKANTFGMIQCPVPPNHLRRKAVLVGVNYNGSHAPLKGCVNDAWNMHALLRHTLQFREEQVRILTDGEHGQSPELAQMPTKANILAGLQWLISG